MGQSQSDTSAAAIDESSKDDNPQPSSLDSLISEAAAYGDDESESIEARAEKALECPCIADLRKGPCGGQFSEAFLCFMKSTAEEKGSDCVHPFVALQSCIKTNPDAFPKDVVEDDKHGNKEASTAGQRLIPPTWSLESSSPKPRL